MRQGKEVINDHKFGSLSVLGLILMILLALKTNLYGMWDTSIGHFFFIPRVLPYITPLLLLDLTFYW